MLSSLHMYKIGMNFVSLLGSLAMKFAFYARPRTSHFGASSTEPPPHDWLPTDSSAGRSWPDRHVMHKTTALLQASKVFRETLKICQSYHSIANWCSLRRTVAVLPGIYASSDRLLVQGQARAVGVPGACISVYGMDRAGFSALL
jgi:hypothetical protein